MFTLYGLIKSWVPDRLKRTSCTVCNCEIHKRYHVLNGCDRFLQTRFPCQTLDCYLCLLERTQHTHELQLSNPFCVSVECYNPQCFNAK